MLSEKVLLRDRMRKLRRELACEERERLSRLACQRLMSSRLWRESDIVCLFVSLAEEISTWPLLTEAWSESKELYLPKISPYEKGSMDFYKCSSRHELVEGKFGLLEPQEGQPVALASGPALLIAPGLAFDRTGRRLGYGGGYYDRYLNNFPQRIKVRMGLAFSFQLLETAPGDEHDQKMDCLCTEEGLIWSNV